MADDILSELKKKYGNASIFRGDEGRELDIVVRGSGSLMLDLALGGGYPKGRIVELHGAERSGKTSLLCMAIAEAQISEPDKHCSIIDTEHAFNPTWASTLGVDMKKLFISQPDTYAEKVLEMVEDMINSGKFAIIGVDSVAGLVTKDELEESDWTKEGRVGGISKIMSKAMRKLINSGILQRSGTTLVFINQLRDKIGGFSMFGIPTDTPGGRAIKFAYSQRLEVACGEQFVKGTGASREVLGQQIKIKIGKNKISAPYKTASVDLYYKEGVDRLMELVSVAKEINVLQGTSWLKLIDPRTGEIIPDSKGNEIKYNGIQKTIEALKIDISNGGELYSKLFTIVNGVLRGE